jgi:putative glycosyltransferase (TIGR04372 family)
LKLFLQIRIYFFLIVCKIINLPLVICNGFFCIFFLKKFIGILPNHSLGVCIYYAENIIAYAEINNILLNDITIYTNDIDEDCNHTIINLYSRKINIVRNKYIYKALLNGGIEALLLLSRGIPKFITGKRYYSIIGKKVNIFFCSHEVNLGWKLLSRLGIEECDKLALVSSRSNQYWISRGAAGVNSEIHRNSEFEDLTDAIHELNNLGFKVVRMGQYSAEEPKTNWISLNIFSKDERDFIDVFLNSISSIVLSGNSGLAYLSACFGKPTLIHNMFPFAELPTIYNSLVIPKIIINKKTNRILKLKDYLNFKKIVVNWDEYILPRLNFLDAMSIREPIFFNNNNLIIIDNTSVDILNGINEILHYDQINIKNAQKHYFFGINKYRILKDFGGVISPSYLSRYNN